MANRDNLSRITDPSVTSDWSTEEQFWRSNPWDADDAYAGYAEKNGIKKADENFPTIDEVRERDREYTAYLKRKEQSK